jgi:hypothetical protein
LPPALWLLLGERLEQDPGLLQVGSLKPLREPVIDLGQQRMGGLPLALLLPQTRQAHSSPQLQGFGLLAAGHSEGLQKASFHLLGAV